MPRAGVRPLGPSAPEEFIHYGTHFTNMFLRCHPERITTRRIHAEDRLSVLDALRAEAEDVGSPEPLGLVG